MGDGDDIVALVASSTGLSGSVDSVTVHGENGRDALWTSLGSDTLDGGAGSDWLSGGAGDDVLLGGDESDFGADGKDNWTALDFAGRKFNDILDGGDGSDIVHGGAGADLLALGKGNDTLQGGSGADLFVAEGDWGNDQIGDFDFAGGDRLAAIGFAPADVTFEAELDRLTLFMQGHGTIVLHGFALPANVTTADLFL
jgi:Ca2+-binding RTX toxin-like protein